MISFIFEFSLDVDIAATLSGLDPILWEYLVFPAFIGKTDDDTKEKNK